MVTPFQIQSETYMNNIPDIINADIVHHEWDIYWNELPEELKMATPADVLIATLPSSETGAEKIQIEKMMLACKLDATQYNIIHINKDERIAWHKIKEAWKPKYVILLGVLPSQLGISASFRLYCANNFDECVFIASLSPQEMEQQPEVKKQLWAEGLKPVFVDSLQQ